MSALTQKADIRQREQQTRPGQTEAGAASNWRVSWDASR